MLKHFVFLWCSYPILFPSTKLWILVRNIWRSFSARILQSGNPDKADELIPKASCNSNTYSMLQATIVLHVLLISWSNHVYVYIMYIYIYHIYSFFFTAKYVPFLLASFLRQKMLRLVLSWRSWTDMASTCFSDSAVRVKNTFARQIGKEKFCWLAEHPCQCAKLNIKSHPVHGFSSFWCLEILTLTIFNQFFTFEGVNGYLLSLHWLLNPDSRQLLPPHSFGQGKDVVFLTHMSFRSRCFNGWSWRVGIQEIFQKSFQGVTLVTREDGKPQMMRESKIFLSGWTKSSDARIFPSHNFTDRIKKTHMNSNIHVFLLASWGLSAPGCLSQDSKHVFRPGRVFPWAAVLQHWYVQSQLILCFFRLYKWNATLLHTNHHKDILRDFLDFSSKLLSNYCAL